MRPKFIYNNWPEVNSPKGSRAINNSEFNTPFESNTYLNTSDPAIFTSVYQALYPYTFFYACRFVSYENAEDIVASVFLKLWKLTDTSFANIHHIKAFLRVCIKNACLTHMRAEKNHMKKAQAWGEERESEQDTAFRDLSEKAEIHAEKMKRVLEIMEKLPLKCQTVFKMAYLEGLKNKQIAHTLCISENTVKTHKQYALKRLRMDLLSIIIFQICLHNLI
jgi:RNA polymerase sigma-70 factor (family 1)